MGFFPQPVAAHGQRFWLVFAVSGAAAFATGCHRLQPRGSINAPSLVVRRGDSGPAETEQPRPNALSAFHAEAGTSRWSKRNTTLAERLISEGRMQASGIAEVERAKADGRWEAAYAGPANGPRARRLGSCACA
jgi:hypothetical protein